MRIFVCLDRTHNKHKQSIAKFLLPSLNRMVTPLSEHRAFEFHSCEIKKMAENYLNSYFNILQPGVTWLGLQWNTH